jgi:Cdc6-like AAA superfamily ATPase
VPTQQRDPATLCAQVHGDERFAADLCSHNSFIDLA